MQKQIVRTLNYGILQKTAEFAQFTLLMEDLLQRIHFQLKNQVMMQQKEHYCYTTSKEKKISTNFQNGELYCHKSEENQKLEKIMRRKPQNRHIVQSNHTPNLLLKKILQLMILILPSQRKAGKKVIQLHITLILPSQNLNQVNNTKSTKYPSCIISKTFRI